MTDGAGASPRPRRAPARLLWLTGRELGSVALTVLGLRLVTVFLGRVVPFDPVLAAVGDRAPAEVYRSAFQHVILPASILGYYSMAYLCRMTRSFMLSELRHEYVTTARVKGMTERRVVWRHALGNVLVPLITVVALSYANLLEGSVLTETVFAWPGLGQYITSSLLNADMNAVLGGTIVVGAIFIGLNVLSDLLYRVVDPRAR